MDPSSAILIKTFATTLDAESAAAQLRSRGIEYLITTDDCGGMYPPLGVTKMFVAPGDAEAARVILNQPPASEAESAIPTEPERFESHPSPPRVYRFNAGFAVGIFVGVLLHVSYIKYRSHRDRVDWLDRNNDGRADVWLHYEDGQLMREESDDNFDGRKDVWYSLTSEGITRRIEQDTDYDGIPDFVTFYTNGLPIRTDWKPSNTNVIVLREVFHNGILAEKLRDTNGDGNFDVSVTFDSYNTPVSTNLLQPSLP